MTGGKNVRGEKCPDTSSSVQSSSVTSLILCTGLKKLAITDWTKERQRAAAFRALSLPSPYLPSREKFGW